jgi:hypothetical protein
LPLKFFTRIELPTPLPIHSHFRNNLGLKLVNIDVEKPRNQALPPSLRPLPTITLDYYEPLQNDTPDIDMQNDNEEAVPIIEPSPTMNTTQETSQLILPTASHPLLPKATI